MEIVQSRLRSPSDVLAAVPYLLGYRPEDSIVVLGLRRKKIVFQVRTDLPPTETAGPVALQIADVVARQNVTGAVVVGYGPHERVWPTVGPLCPELLRSGIEILEALRADDGRYWSYVCGSEECCPSWGTRYDVTATEVAAAATFAGMRPADSRDELVARLGPPTLLARLAAEQATARAEARLFDLIASVSPEESAEPVRLNELIADMVRAGRAKAEDADPAAPPIRRDTTDAGRPAATRSAARSVEVRSTGMRADRAGNGSVVARATDSPTGIRARDTSAGVRAADPAADGPAPDGPTESGRVDRPAEARNVDGPAEIQDSDAHGVAASGFDGRPRGRSERELVVLRAGFDAVDAAVAGGPGLDDDDLAWLALLLTHTPVRDHAWISVRGELGPHIDLWSDVVRRVDPMLAAAPATLLAFAAWRSGDGTTASIALERALQADPGYPMARLLADAIAGGLAPGAWLDEEPDPAGQRHHRATRRAVPRTTRRRASARRDPR